MMPTLHGPTVAEVLEMLAPGTRYHGELSHTACTLPNCPIQTSRYRVGGGCVSPRYQSQCWPLGNFRYLMQVSFNKASVSISGPVV